MAARTGITLRVIPTEAPWQIGAVESHGAVIASIVNVLVDEFSIEGPDDMDLVFTTAALAKNRRPDASGFSPRVRVFGCPERLPGSVLDAVMEDEEGPQYGLHSYIAKDQALGRATRMRAAAFAAQERLDANEKWRQALLHQRPIPRNWFPGECVFYWRMETSKNKIKGRYARRIDRWNGPAVVLARERNDRDEENEAYWIVHNGNLLLVAPQHLRSATPEERLSSETIQQLMCVHGRVRSHRSRPTYL